MKTIVVGFVMFLMTVLIFAATRKLYSRYPNPFFNPVLISSVIVVVFLVLVKIPYETYMIGGQWIHHFLGPVVVALGYPLYKQKAILVKYFLPIFSGMLTGIVVSVFTGLLATYLLGTVGELIPSVVTKSITTPIALQVTEQLNGLTSLTAVFVMIAGFTGILLGPSLIKICKIETPIGRGMAFGSASHAVGTTKAFEYGLDAGSISSAAMTLTAVFGSFIIPFLIQMVL